jgi:hypothetical protein
VEEEIDFLLLGFIAKTQSFPGFLGLKHAESWVFFRAKTFRALR